VRKFHDNAESFPIPGAAGACVRAALRAMALYPGATSVTVKKERLPGGGYAYLIAESQSTPLNATANEEA
jgi:hypothetical protein